MTRDDMRRLICPRVVNVATSGFLSYEEPCCTSFAEFSQGFLCPECGGDMYEFVGTALSGSVYTAITRQIVHPWKRTA